MPLDKPRKLSEWVDFLTAAEIPVLKQTARNISKLQHDAQHMNARSFAQIVKNDPLMTVKLLRYLQSHKQLAQKHDVIEIEQIALMIGLETTLEKVAPEPLVEEILNQSGNMAALVHLLKTAHRANMAAGYAFDWAVRLHDLHYEEIRTATLLHDIAEMLMWCFSPKEMLQIKTSQMNDKTLRSVVAQQNVLGFTLNQLQVELAIKWRLPELLIALTDDKNKTQQRVRNVILAVNLARHSANGWDDAALPDDYEDIAKLLHLQASEVMIIVGAEI
ncbi:MAG TPA: HDOD domain-containing protein [Nitrosomonas sp.]|nr:HDOD domain-containing protein [Nitrosomonas sp.]HQX14162.1 HDOD domain-containing protein [Nitrosomonas sp.]HRB21055.1 HDOD domain-containing protein [Nitrosomonas sp.]HRB32133.1 HDOD domain-containing protein [Nitrosomonas sp.]HRB45777.1 HDOD domain-containing protein [Nitrosomonas sp.]